MINKYIVEIKGIKDNKNCWRNMGQVDNLKDAMEIYKIYISGCCKRIKRVRTITKIKVMRFKKY